MNGIHQWLTAAAKETRLILRDRQALGILFVMPVVFVAILSLALRDAFSEHAGVTFRMLIVDHDGQRVGQVLTEAFQNDRHYQVELPAPPLPDSEEVAAQVQSGRVQFALIIPAQATTQARRRAVEQVRRTGNARTPTAPVVLKLLADPNIRADHRALVQAFANGALHRLEAGLIAERVADLARGPAGTPAVSASGLSQPRLFDELTDPTEKNGKSSPVPTSVQQNAPAWTLLAMFFLAIPLSVTFIQERTQGSLLRLQSMPVPAWVLFGGKILPYVIINQVQLFLILGFGVWGLPLLGGDRLDLGHAPGAIVLLGFSASFAAIGFALLIATVARTAEQATTLSATTVLVLAAIGGILVPKLVMPPAMQQLAQLSPFSWGLEGFLDVLIRQGGVHEVLPECGQLLAFAAVCFTLAILRYQWRLRQR